MENQIYSSSQLEKRGMEKETVINKSHFKEIIINFTMPGDLHTLLSSMVEHENF
jgi:hypothetical protein